MKPLLVASLLVLLVVHDVRAEGTVKLDTGEISGTVVEKDGAPPVRAFKGVPFAAPPVGELRWKPPARAKKWEGVRACTKVGAACPQPAVPLFTVAEGQSEDCLYLNVWTAAPAGETSTKLPVMVWIHGGSYTFGSGGQDMYDGTSLARQGVVVVTINYRLGPFGFLSHPALSKESGHGGSGNYGLLDQVAALEWVQRNIAAFGGDPGSVTIFGESAGGGSVMALLMSPLGKGLFHRAISQSGVCFARHLRTSVFGLEAAEKTGEKLAEKLGCAGAADVAAALRAKSAKELLEAAAPAVNPAASEGMGFGLVVDGRVLTDDPFVLMNAGKIADVPLLMGTTADEGTIFVTMTPHTKSAAAYRAFVRSLFATESDRVLERYAAASDEEIKDQLAALLGDSLFVAPARAFLRAHGRVAKSKAYLYQFTRVSPGAKAFGLGAYHGSELRYVFDTTAGSSSMGMVKADHALGKTVSAAWARFAKTGDPNGGGLVEWPAFTAENDAHLEIGDRIRASSGLRKAECDFFETVWRGLSLTGAKAAKRWF